MNKKTLLHLKKMKRMGEKITMLTAYDASFTRVLNKADIDVILIGDTLGNVIQGHDTTLPVQIDDVIYHLSCVARTNEASLLMADLPFMTYSNTIDALRNAAKLMQAGASIIKLEGGLVFCETVKQMTENGIPVCGHLGLRPQSVNVIGGYHVQGKTTDSAQCIINDAKALQEAGCQLLILECVPTQLAQEITQMLNIPVIGIGAGPHCDGQVLVLYDMLGISSQFSPKFVKNFLTEDTASVENAIKAYAKAVKSGEFPAQEHCFT